MSKRRKTREEKILSDSRKTQPYSVSSPVTFSLPSTYKVETKKEYVAQSTPFNHDLKKTLLVSAGIIFFQLTLFFLLKQHVVVMPFASLQ